MKTVHITKFEVNPEKNYLAPESKKSISPFVCQLLERNGKDLVFNIVNFITRENIGQTTTQAKIVEDAGKLCETVRLMTPDGWETFYANNWCGYGRSVSTLPAEEQKNIMESVARDVEFRKKNPQYNNSETMTEYDANGNISNIHRI